MKSNPWLWALCCRKGGLASKPPEPNLARVEISVGKLGSSFPFHDSIDTMLIITTISYRTTIYTTAVVGVGGCWISTVTPWDDALLWTLFGGLAGRRGVRREWRSPRRVWRKKGETDQGTLCRNLGPWAKQASDLTNALNLALAVSSICSVVLSTAPSCL